MPSRSATTNATIDLKDTGYSLPEWDQVELQNRYLRWAARRAFKTSIPATVRLDPYLLNISAATPWLPSVERRIEDSIIPNEYKDWRSTEWLSEEVGQAAIRFFQSAADVLPAEPHIYASKRGALVAEFETPKGTMTTVISPDATILFAVKADKPDAPVEITLNRGSNRLREELKTIIRFLTGPHGQMGPAT